MKKLPLLIAFAVALFVAGCGVKNDLEKPNGQPVKKGQTDPSKPPSTLGR